MALVDAIRNALNPSGMQGLPMQYTPNAGIFKNIAGLINAGMMAQPQYSARELNRQNVMGKQIENQNMPIYNALRNQLMQQQGTELGIKNQYLPQDMQSQIGLRNAQIELDKRKAQNPFFGQMFSGPAGQVQGLEFIRQQYGENSPQYQDARRMFDTQLNQKQTMTDYYGSNVEYKNLTPTQKLELAKQKAEQTGDNDLVNTYGLAQQKYTSDSKNREAILKAKQIEQTIGAIDFPTVSQYFGPQGRLKAANDYMSAMGGNVSPEYDKYHRFVTVQGPETAKQLRQYFGDSIQPEIAKQYDKLVTPDYWQSNPELAMRQFDELVNMFKRDSSVRIGAMTDQNIYRKEDEIKRPMGEQQVKTNKPQYSQEELEHTAKKYGLSVEQVKQRLGVK